MIDDYVEDDSSDLDPSQSTDLPKEGDSSSVTEPSPAHYRVNNEGGYGNPPVSGQFKKGGEGGPGRRKGQTSLESAMRKITRKKLPVNTDGKVKNMSPADILAQRTLETALAKNPSPRMLELAHNIFAKYGPREEENTKFDISSYSVDELNIIMAVLNGILNLSLKPSNKDATRIEDRFDNEGIYRIYVRDDGNIGFQKLPDTSDVSNVA